MSDPYPLSRPHNLGFSALEPCGHFNGIGLLKGKTLEKGHIMLASTIFSLFYKFQKDLYVW